MTFREFLKMPRKWSVYQALFVHDALHDKNFPDVSSLDEILDYLPWHPTNGMEVQARIIWKKYQAAPLTEHPA